eukprot:Selendium_serpulae@DN5452_c0_g1_i2.p1
MSSVTPVAQLFAKFVTPTVAGRLGKRAHRRLEKAAGLNMPKLHNWEDDSSSGDDIFNGGSDRDLTSHPIAKSHVILPSTEMHDGSPIPAELQTSTSKFQQASKVMSPGARLADSGASIYSIRSTSGMGDVYSIKSTSGTGDTSEVASPATGGDESFYRHRQVGCVGDTILALPSEKLRPADPTQKKLEDFQLMKRFFQGMALCSRHQVRKVADLLRNKVSDPQESVDRIPGHTLPRSASATPTLTNGDHNSVYVRRRRDVTQDFDDSPVTVLEVMRVLSWLVQADPNCV